jgi:hypothetical protein
MLMKVFGKTLFAKKMRPEKVISSKTHGIIDYIAAPSLMVLPRLLRWPQRVTTMLTGVGIFHLLYSMFTRYELGVVKVLPYKGHLALDGALAAGTLASPMLFTEAKQESYVGKALIGMAVFEAVVTALSLVNRKR